MTGAQAAVGSTPPFSPSACVPAGVAVPPSARLTASAGQCTGPTRVGVAARRIQTRAVRLGSLAHTYVPGRREPVVDGCAISCESGMEAVQRHETVRAHCFVESVGCGGPGSRRVRRYRAAENGRVCGY